MKQFFYQLVKYLKRTIWTVIVTYMVGIHNFNKGEDKTPDDIVITIEHEEVQEDSRPKD